MQSIRTKYTLPENSVGPAGAAHWLNGEVSAIMPGVTPGSSVKKYLNVRWSVSRAGQPVLLKMTALISVKFVPDALTAAVTWSWSSSTISVPGKLAAGVPPNSFVRRASAKTNPAL